MALGEQKVAGVSRRWNGWIEDAGVNREWQGVSRGWQGVSRRWNGWIEGAGGV